MGAKKTLERSPGEDEEPVALYEGKHNHPHGGARASPPGAISEAAPLPIDMPPESCDSAAARPMLPMPAVVPRVAPMPALQPLNTMGGVPGLVVGATSMQ